MSDDNFSKAIDYAFQLVAGADLSIGFVKGTGLGAILLAIIAVSFIRSKPFLRARLADLVGAVRGTKLPPSSE